MTSSPGEISAILVDRTGCALQREAESDLRAGELSVLDTLTQRDRALQQQRQVLKDIGLGLRIAFPAAPPAARFAQAIQQKTETEAARQLNQLLEPADPPRFTALIR